MISEVGANEASEQEHTEIDNHFYTQCDIRIMSTSKKRSPFQPKEISRSMMISIKSAINPSFIFSAHSLPRGMADRTARLPCYPDNSTLLDVPKIP
jgi:hypothetical protein